MSTAGTATISRGYQYKHGDRPLDGYTIQRAAGRGGFGEVYYAVSDSGREVALKLIQTYEQIELRGISHCMNLKSPHLVTIFDVKYGQDTRPWVIMEFVNGPSLRELIDAAPSGLGIQKSAFFLREIAKGLTYLHECGIVHRDLKPGNIFYENGYAKIGDYGLSKAISTSQYSGQTVTVGTVHYMAPEIGEGRYDKSIDIYALGVLLYEMLTGQVPFFGASPAEVLMKHLNGQVDVSGVEEPFASVIKKAMAKNTAERYQSVQEMVEAVFGSEHVRNSVSHFSPESLTMVAGQVARNLPGNSSFSNSSGAAGPTPANPWNRFGQNVEQAVNRMNDVIADHVDRVVNGSLNNVTDKMEMRRQKMEQRLAAKRERMERRWAKWKNRRGFAPIAGWQQQQQQGQGYQFQQQGQGPGQPMQPLLPVMAGDDPVSPGQRKGLAAIAIGVVAIGTGVAANEHANAPIASALFVGLSILGATLGVLIGRWRVWPGLPAEPKFLRKLAVGGMAGAFAAVLSLPIGAAGDREIHGVGGCWLAVLLCMFLLDWDKRTSPDREQRVSLMDAFLVAILGAIVGGAFDGTSILVAGIVAGTSLAVEIASVWSPSGANDRKNRQRAAPYTPPAPPTPGMTPAPQAQAQVQSPYVAPAAMAANAANFGGTPAAPDAVTVVRAAGAVPRPVSKGARVTWIIFFSIFLALGLFLLAMLGVGRNQPDVSAALLGFGTVSLLFSALCVRRSFSLTRRGLWPYVWRPIFQLITGGTAIVCGSMLLVGRIYPNDAPPFIFFTIFPAVVFAVITIFIPRGENMSPALSTAPAQRPVDSEEPGFILGRLVAGAGRMVFSVVGLCILLAAVLIALGVAADVPGLFNSHLVDPQVRRDFQEPFGHADGARIVRTIASAVSFVLAVIAVTILTQVRRRYGWAHMLRAVVGAGLLFLAVQTFSRLLPAWNELVRTQNGWEFLDQYFQHIASHRLMAAIVPAGAGIVLLLWPGERKRLPRFKAMPEEVML